MHSIAFLKKSMACTFTVQTGGDAQPMFQTGQDVLQIFLHSFGAARQVDDERFAAEDAGCTAEHPARGDAQAVVPHGLGDAGRILYRIVQNHFFQRTGE